ncbi:MULTISPECIES: ABC transporter substrate-binding protein [unclassified Streptosporangium]|uniref:ABC transporter substrate-binding protein n=1 Tax=Streptosporangium sp. NPDC005286 TaxID=3154463 RepID=UPI0033AE0EA8
MKKSLRLGVGALTVATLTMLAGCGGGDTAAPEGADGAQTARGKITFAIASAVIGPKEEVAAYAVAKDQGFFDEQNLDVETINADGSVAAIQAVASGSADITAADAGSILAAVEKGVPVKAIGGLVQNWPWVMAVKPGSGIKSGADLKGKKIGVISLASGSSPYARGYVREAGLDPEKDVELLPVGVGAQAASAISSGQVDALALYTQAYATIENSGVTYEYLPNPDMFQGIRSITFAVRKDAFDEKKDVLTRFLRAGYQGMLFSAVNNEAAARIGYTVFPQILAGKSAEDRIADDTKVMAAWLKTATPTTGEPETFADWGAISDQEWTKTAAYTKGAGQITKDPVIADVWDASLLPAANEFDSAAVVSKAKAYSPK